MSKYDRAGDNLISVFNEYIFEYLENTDFSAYIAANQEWKSKNIAAHNSITKQLYRDIGDIRDKIHHTGNCLHVIICLTSYRKSISRINRLGYN